MRRTLCALHSPVCGEQSATSFIARGQLDRVMTLDCNIIELRLCWVIPWYSTFFCLVFSGLSRRKVQKIKVKVCFAFSSLVFRTPNGSHCYFFVCVLPGLGFPTPNRSILIDRQCNAINAISAAYRWHLDGFVCCRFAQCCQCFVSIRIWLELFHVFATLEACFFYEMFTMPAK